MWGAKDELFPPLDQNALLAALPRAELSFYERAGHSLHWGEPERFASDVAAVVEDRRPRRS